MSLSSPASIVLACLVVPALVVLGSAGLGLGVARLSGLALGALTIPAGFAAGMAVMDALFELGLNGKVCAILTAVLAVAGALAGADRRRLRNALRAPRRMRPASVPTWAWAAGAGVAAWAVGMAPIAGWGHLGIVGYVLNDDPAVHTATVELLRAHGAHVLVADSSYTSVAAQFGGYPLGEYVWPLFACVLTGANAFVVWSPICAVTAGVTALAAYAVLRRLGAAAPLAAVGGAVVASGYLPFSYLGQGGAKEVMLASAVLATTALLGAALDAGPSARRAIPAGVALAGAMACFGVGALGPLGPVALLAALLALNSSRELWRRRIGALVGGAAAVLVLASPGLAKSLRFNTETARITQDPNAFGNLLGGVPWRESFNVWLGGDYRLPPTGSHAVTTLGILLAAALAVLGTWHALRRRVYTVPLAVFGTAVAAWYVARHYSTYFEAKFYVSLAVALGLATVAGVVALINRPRLRWLGVGCGAVFLLLVAASDAAVYRQAWFTPKDRFQELEAIDSRFSGQGPMLVNEREDYAKYFLRDVRPFVSWGSWTPQYGLRSGRPAPPPHTPDFDDYTWSFIRTFPLLLDRRRPGGSAPPTGYAAVYQTPHYVVWKRVGPTARDHLSLGVDNTDGTAPLDCSSPPVRAWLLNYRSGRLRIAWHTRRLIVSSPEHWYTYAATQPGVTPGTIVRRGGFAVVTPHLPAGRYTAWIQGEFAPGVRLYSGGDAVGEAKADLGQQDQWLRLGTFSVPSVGAPEVLIGLQRRWWQASSRRPDVTGPVAFEPADYAVRTRIVPGARWRSLCGRRLDWVEAP